MSRRVFQPAIWFVGLLAFARAAEVATAAPYYTTTYVGQKSDLENENGASIYESFYGDSLKNRVTGNVYSFDSGTRFLSERDSAAMDLPKTTVLVGGIDPAPQTFTMIGMSIDDATGTVIGRIPNGGSRGIPWNSTYYGYTKPDGNGNYSEFHALTDWSEIGYSMYLNSADQVLLWHSASSSTPGKGSRMVLINLKAGTEENLRDLVDPEFWGRYARLDVAGLDARGEILLIATPRGEYGTGEPWREEAYILTPPGVDPPTPVPEPSLLWLAAGALGLGVRARWRKPRGA